MAAEKVGWSPVGMDEDREAGRIKRLPEPSKRRINRWRCACLCSWLLFPAAITALVLLRPVRPSCEELPFSLGCAKNLPVKHACDFIAQTGTSPGYLICTGDPQKGGIDRHIHKYGGWSSITTDRLRQALQDGQYCRQSPGPHYVDFGSNIGPFVLFVAALGCEVLAIDGSDIYLSRLTVSAALNGLSNRIEVNRFYLGDADEGTKDFNYEKLRFDAVPVRTIDSIMRDHGQMSRGDQFPLLKIDIEESIAVALKGAKETFRRHLAKKWMIEFWPVVDANWVAKNIVNQGYSGGFTDIPNCNASCTWTAGNGEEFKRAFDFMTRANLWKGSLKNADVAFISNRDKPIS